MRVKVGDEWFESIEGRPIAVELTDQDKANIAAGPMSKRYGVFTGEGITDEEGRAWLLDGIPPEDWPPMPN